MRPHKLANRRDRVMGLIVSKLVVKATKCAAGVMVFHYSSECHMGESSCL